VIEVNYCFFFWRKKCSH